MGGAKTGTGCTPLQPAGTTSLYAGNETMTGLVNNAGTSARFNTPRGLVTNSAGTMLYVCDALNHVVRQVDLSTGAVTTLAGTGASGNADGAAASATFNTPSAVTATADALYIAEPSSHTIRRYSFASGQVATIAGSAGNSGNTDGTGTDARFNFPVSLTTDGTDLYVGESSGNTIRKINPATGAVTTIAGQSGVSGSADGTGTAATFGSPFSMTINNRNLYIVDLTNHSIRRMNLDTSLVSTFAGQSGTSGFADGVGTAAMFNSPRDILSDGTYLWLTDSSNQVIRRITIADGQVATIIGQQGTAGHTEGTGTGATLTSPFRMAQDGTNLYFHGGTAHYIRRVR